ncbi:DEAD/DEAH box helicase [Kamptonema formosum]|uniref:DEAD/DEAH box helicase n=1 Tax=Kamptonema formosum TaxID=331992 RepID=UPI0003460972|nr:helicase-related protein [Oscillatoria sp. PCC 10802]
MPPLLRDRPWKISYASNQNNPVAEFYIPALECAVQYDRKSGFFSSAILSKVARGIGAMLYNKGRMRLILGCQFTPEDLQAIRRGYSLRDTLIARLHADLKPPENLAQLKHFEILSWLIQTCSLDIKIAIPLTADGSPEDSQRQLEPHHIFHEKAGIFTDTAGEQLAFSGSNNESLGGWETNVESFHVYCSWEEGRELERVREESLRFEQLWSNSAPNVRVFDIPEAIQKKLLRYAPATQPTWSRHTEFDTTPLPNSPHPLPAGTRKESELFTQLAELHRHPGCLDFCLKSIPIKPWPHQLKILRRVAQHFPHNFLIADEVGLGKTIVTGLILRYGLLTKKATRVLILAPASVQPQWQEELREKFNLHFWSYTRGEFKAPCQKETRFLQETGFLNPNPWNTQNLILASSHLVRRQDRMEELLSAQPWDLVILDEAHHARRQTPQSRKETPNRLLQLMQQLKHKTRSLILLSATPMQIDPIEIFDLLQLLGLQGHWAHGDNFCNYFTTLAGQPNRDILDFWQQMSQDYFNRGGSPCPRLQKYQEKTDRLLAYRMRDIWMRGQKIANSRHDLHHLEDTPFLSASRQYLTANTPLKDLMFRHTRHTLREYRRRGILDSDIPIREVRDSAITLEPTREIPLYIAVSDYVRHFYKLAQKESRKALGFLMTLYRKRLTSSFYAIKESLQRRLEGISITPDDLGDLEDAGDAIIEGLESYFAPDPQEIEYLENLLRRFETTGEDTKLSHFIALLRQEFTQRESALVFTQYTDTMDYLRSALQQLYGPQVACYSGRGGELYREGSWRAVPKEEIKRRFRDKQIKILLCTESASEGLNLQTCGVLINYDMPWNPMRVEQRIGRIDRIGQVHPTVRIHNFYYDGTVEAKVYRKLRERINIFTAVVGNLQPILAQVPTFIERAAMSADPEEEGVLLAEFEDILQAPPVRPNLDEIAAMDVEADLEEIRRQIPPAPLTPESIEQLFVNSELLKTCGAIFEPAGERTWQLTYRNYNCKVTFYPEIFDQMPSLRLMSFADPLFEELLQTVTSRLS